MCEMGDLCDERESCIVFGIFQKNHVHRYKIIQPACSGNDLSL